jgi:hypothetical protein
VEQSQQTAQTATDGIEVVIEMKSEMRWVNRFKCKSKRICKCRCSSTIIYLLSCNLSPLIIAVSWSWLQLTYTICKHFITVM